MKNSLPPFNQRDKRMFLEERILDISSILFYIPIIGLIISAISNILLYISYESFKDIFSLIIYVLTCFYILNLIIDQLICFQKNE